MKKGNFDPFFMSNVSIPRQSLCLAGFHVLARSGPIGGSALFPSARVDLNRRQRRGETTRRLRNRFEDRQKNPARFIPGRLREFQAIPRDRATAMRARRVRYRLFAPGPGERDAREKGPRVELPRSFSLREFRCTQLPCFCAVSSRTSPSECCSVGQDALQ